jgi:hypothetical protein
VWLFAFPRSGTTWLGSMMADIADHEMWDEPYVGALFGEFYLRHNGDNQTRPFILAPHYREVWLRSLRSLILESARARFPRLGAQRRLLVIKEPHGCMGAPLLSEALPESRMILLLRDPRDVIASNLDSQRSGSWTARDPRWKGKKKPLTAADRNPERFVTYFARDYMRDIRMARRAYDAHPGPKALLKYEDLRLDPTTVMLGMYSQLGVPVQDEDLAVVIERHAWSNIPKDQTGPGQFHRKAEPGAWTEDLTEEQARIVEDATQPILDTFYSRSSEDA